MNFLRWVEVMSLILSIVFLVTQVAWPLIRGTKPFPIFRREGELERGLDQKRQEKLNKSLEHKIGRKKR